MALLASDTATKLTVQAEAALRRGDTGEAKALFKQAGEVLEQAVQRTRKQSEKSLHRFLAATQYFKGGHYGKASSLCNKIQVNLLPDSVRELYRPFLKEVRRRAALNYLKELREEFLDYYSNGRYQEVLELLKSHPYAYTPTAAAFIRAVCCENLKEYRAAALFFADAIRSSPDDVNLVFVSASHTFALIGQRSFGDAQVYLNHQMDLLPNALTYINAAMLRFNQASSGSVENLQRQKLFEEQVGYFATAWEKFRNLPASYRENRELRDFMILALEGAALAHQRLGQLERALALCAEGIAFAPQSPHLRTIRGIIAYPEAGAVSDFEEAIRLGETLYYPLYFLAHNALLKGDFEDALRRCDQAIQRRPGEEILAQLLEWKAISLWHLAGDPDEIRRLFRQALGLAPGRPGIVRSLARFEQWAAARSLPMPELPRDDLRAEKPDGEYIAHRKRPLETSLPRKARERELASLSPAGSPA
jgi:tetratricopeptide (TPR) repeat protein